MSYEAGSEGAYADFELAKKSGARFTPKVTNAAKGVVAWEEHCRKHHDHPTPPPTPRPYLSVESWCKWRSSVNGIGVGSTTVHPRQRDLLAELERLRASAAANRVRSPPLPEVLSPPLSPSPSPEPVLISEEDGVASDDGGHVAAARKLGSAYRSSPQAVNSSEGVRDDDDDSAPAPSSKSTYRSAPASPVKPSAKSNPKKATSAVKPASRARSNVDPSRATSSPKKACLPPLTKSASAHTSGKLFAVESVSAVLPGASASKARARSSSPRKAARSSPRLPVFIDDSSEDETESEPEVKGKTKAKGKARAKEPEPSDGRSYVVMAQGYKPRVFDSLALAREFVKELAEFNIWAYIEGARTDEELNSLLFGA
ncbi:hypothetical protein FB107DRAFT_280206 [Schizophyllum commune]